MTALTSGRDPTSPKPTPPPDPVVPHRILSSLPDPVGLAPGGGPGTLSRRGARHGQTGSGGDDGIECGIQRGHAVDIAPRGDGCVDRPVHARNAFLSAEETLLRDGIPDVPVGVLSTIPYSVDEHQAIGEAVLLLVPSESCPGQTGSSTRGHVIPGWDVDTAPLSTLGPPGNPFADDRTAPGRPDSVSDAGATEGTRAFLVRYTPLLDAVGHGRRRTKSVRTRVVVTGGWEMTLLGSLPSGRVRESQGMDAIVLDRTETLFTRQELQRIALRRENLFVLAPKRIMTRERCVLSMTVVGPDELAFVEVAPTNGALPLAGIARHVVAHTRLSPGLSLAPPCPPQQWPDGPDRLSDGPDGISDGPEQGVWWMERELPEYYVVKAPLRETPRFVLVDVESRVLDGVPMVMLATPVELSASGTVLQYAALRQEPSGRGLQRIGQRLVLRPLAFFAARPVPESLGIDDADICDLSPLVAMPGRTA